ncbi:MAG: hypothetical protein AAFR39_14775 [Pseudomonadota bacterium]
MASTQTHTHTEVKTVTRVHALTGVAEHFMDQTAEAGASWTHIRKNVKVIIALQLIDWLEVSLHVKDEPKPIAGVRWAVDWDQHEAILVNTSEDYDPALLDGYGRPGSATETISAMREYIDAIKAECDVSKVEAWYRPNHARILEYGEDRFYELIGRGVPSAEERKRDREDYAHVQAAKNEKDSHTEVSGSDLSEATGSAW